MEINAAFQWKCHPQAEALITEILDKATHANAFIGDLARDLEKQTSTRLFDWIDHVAVSTSGLEQKLSETGFIGDHATSTYRVFFHPGAQLPRVVLYQSAEEVIEVALNVDCIADFLMVRGLSRRIEGSPFSRYRRCCVSKENKAFLWVVERRGARTVEPIYENEGYLENYFEAQEKWRSRPRDLLDEEDALLKTLSIAQDIAKVLGEGLAACLILEGERAYWQARNKAAQTQKNRQDRLGMGWANHDHHTFRSSRRHFIHLVHLFEILGFKCRERFYAGEEAGWGAQVMENANCRLVLFLDVDLQAEELAVDFAHHSLPELEQLGTIGLWCALHGDSILKAGMHHLEAQFLFEELSKDLVNLGIGMMEPFSSFPYLKQAFTHGDIWPVASFKVKALVESGKITSQQADKFVAYGAIGSHLENLQRREGYKGFNQKNVSFIIKKTDPRS